MPRFWRCWRWRLLVGCWWVSAAWVCFWRGGRGVSSAEALAFERLVRRGAVINKIRRIHRRRALSRPIPGWWLRTSMRIDNRRALPW